MNGATRRRRRRIVVKLGSRILTGGTSSLSADRVAMLVGAMVADRDTETVVVSSGAIAAGYSALGLSAPPRRIAERQAAAAVGQAKLMHMYAEHFGRYGITVGQVLLTNDCLLDRVRFTNAKRTFEALLGSGVVPIVNENDTVSVDEIAVGDNDNLAAHTAALVEADLLILLTDVAGVFDRDPSDPAARLVSEADTAERLRPLCHAKRSRESRGGMVTKVEAAGKAAAYGIPTVIASGWDADAIRAACAGAPAGTRIHPSRTPLQARTHWMAVQSRVPGALEADEGALQALRRGSSLLPAGVVRVLGRFRRGDLVKIVDAAGTERARGVAAFGDREVDRIKGRHSRDVRGILGYAAPVEIILADKLLVREVE